MVVVIGDGVMLLLVNEIVGLEVGILLVEMINKVVEFGVVFMLLLTYEIKTDEVEVAGLEVSILLVVIYVKVFGVVVRLLLVEKIRTDEVVGIVGWEV